MVCGSLCFYSNFPLSRGPRWFLLLWLLLLLGAPHLGYGVKAFIIYAFVLLDG